jgi:hypothetical protein
MDERKRRQVLRACDYFLRGVIASKEACHHVILSCDEPTEVADYLRLLPVPLLDAVVKYLPELPMSDDEWVNYQGVGMRDGDEYAWEEMIVQYRAGTEAIRAFLGVTPEPESPGFRDRVRAACRNRMARFDETK